jgi:hypothetical protein
VGRWVWMIFASLLAAGLPSETDAQGANLRAVFDPDMLGAQVAYLEHIIGPAWKVVRGTRIYKVDGCVVDVGVNSGEVRNLHMQISEQCQFDLSVFSGNYKFPRLFGLTFGEFEQPYVSGQFQASCLYLCGNSADPVVRDFYQGPHAENFIQMVPEVVLVSDAAIAASSAWSDAMKNAMGEDYVVNTKFNCDRRFDALAHRLFAKVPITGITVGYDIRACGQTLPRYGGIRARRIPRSWWRACHIGWRCVAAP